MRASTVFLLLGLLSVEGRITMGIPPEDIPPGYRVRGVLQEDLPEEDNLQEDFQSSTRPPDKKETDERLSSSRVHTFHRPGRHVCTKQRIVTRPVTVKETFCKPHYKPIQKPCSDDTSRNCADFKIVFETAHRTVKKMNVTKEISHSCCPGWKRAHRTGSGCLKAICSRGCRNRGSCVAPEMCSCPAGYTGSLCEKLLCNTRCYNGGECVHPNRCRCPADFNGRFCERESPPNWLDTAETTLSEKRTQLSTTVTFLVEAIGVLEQRMALLEKKIGDTAVQLTHVELNSSGSEEKASNASQPAEASEGNCEDTGSVSVRP